MKRVLGSYAWGTACWALAVVGYWAPWLPQKSAALRLSGFELAEWVTLLPEVMFDESPVGRLTFLAPLACLAVLGPLAAPRHTAWWKASPPVVAGLIFGLAILPPYPLILDSLNDPQLRTQLALALLTIAGVFAGAAARLAAGAAKASITLVFGTGALLYSTQSILFLRLPYEELLRASLTPGWGWLAMMLGMAGTVAGATFALIDGLLRLRKSMQAD